MRRAFFARHGESEYSVRELLNGDVAGNAVPSPLIHRGVPLASRAICTLSGIWNGLTLSCGYGSAMFSGAGTFW